MADQVKEAEDNNALPEGTKIGGLEPIPTGEFLKLQDASKDFVKKYGEPDLHSLLVKVGSNSILAKQVVEDLLSEKFGGEQSAPTPIAEAQAPQEMNITGKLDHTEDTAVRIKEGPAADVKPSGMVN